MKIFITLILSNVWFLTLAQPDSVETKFQYVDAITIDRNFNHKYQQSLYMIKRAYPLALEAKRIVDEMDEGLEQIEKKRKKKKYSKEVQKDLKSEFTYLLKDLYTSEGAMLMKLIHRETGMTIDEIIRKYRSKSQAATAHATFKLFGHDTKKTFDATGKDWITDIVIQDIESGKISFDTEIAKIDKAKYKSNMKEYRQGIKDYNKGKRERRKNDRKKKKSSKNEGLSIRADQ